VDFDEIGEVELDLVQIGEVGGKWGRIGESGGDPARTGDRRSAALIPVSAIEAARL
jgi:hypothetical protein